MFPFPSSCSCSGFENGNENMVAKGTLKSLMKKQISYYIEIKSLGWIIPKPIFQTKYSILSKKNSTHVTKPNLLNQI